MNGTLNGLNGNSANLATRTPGEPIKTSNYLEKLDGLTNETNDVYQQDAVNGEQSSATEQRQNEPRSEQRSEQVESHV